VRIGIFGVPNSGKSQFRRWLVRKLREVGMKAEHWDADRFKKSRCPEDNDMREPADDPSIIWIIEDVRGTVPHKEVVKEGEKEGAWKALSYYDIIVYLNPDWPTYSAFWVSRALQWKKSGAGNWMRESGWEDLDDEEVIIRKVQHFLNGKEVWAAQDKETLLNEPSLSYYYVQPLYTQAGIEWRGFDIEFLVRNYRSAQSVS